MLMRGWGRGIRRCVAARPDRNNPPSQPTPHPAPARRQVADGRKPQGLCDVLSTHGAGGKAIVFTRTKAGADEIAAVVSQQQVRAPPAARPRGLEGVGSCMRCWLWSRRPRRRAQPRHPMALRRARQEAGAGCLLLRARRRPARSGHHASRPCTSTAPSPNPCPNPAHPKP